MPTEVTVAIIAGIFAILSTVISTALNMYFTKKNNSRKDRDLEIRALVCLLRSSMLREYDDYTSKKYCTVNEKENLSEQYETYHGLGGNGMMTALYEEMMKLPSEEPSHHDHDE